MERLCIPLSFASQSLSTSVFDVMTINYAIEEEAFTQKSMPHVSHCVYVEIHKASILANANCCSDMVLLAFYQGTS